MVKLHPGVHAETYLQEGLWVHLSQGLPVTPPTQQQQMEQMNLLVLKFSETPLMDTPPPPRP